MGEYNATPALNTRIYDVMISDGSVQQYGANIIAENMFTQVDEYEYQKILLDKIVDHHTLQCKRLMHMSLINIEGSLED